jgi:hypothetical protein
MILKKAMNARTPAKTAGNINCFICKLNITGFVRAHIGLGCGDNPAKNVISSKTGRMANTTKTTASKSARGRLVILTDINKRPPVIPKRTLSQTREYCKYPMNEIERLPPPCLTAHRSEKIKSTTNAEKKNILIHF